MSTVIPAPASRDLPAAVLWDMDGTLVDTEPYWMRAEHELVEEFGGTWTHELALQLVGNPLLVSARFILENSPVDLSPEEVVHRLQSRVIEQIAHEIPWRPGARELLAACREADLPSALVTMSWTDLAQAVVDATEPGSFGLVVTGDIVTQGKPHPEPYLTAAARLGVDPAACVAIEDSPTGVRSAVAAGVPTLAVPHVVEVPAIDGAVPLTTLVGVTPFDLMALATGAQQPARP
ncbi:HAD family hydrolase [Janibacter limosus]|uniref:HAD family hydrolase n=1 Tax=Janibacter limosus TaxID=53458 RepID=UPI0008368B40|nr:HAD family phosphatase [Janibacter limosus]